MSEYPKQMRFSKPFDHKQEVTVLAPPNDRGYVPVRCANGDYWISAFDRLCLPPSPDDEVEVVVKMTRELRDKAAANMVWGHCTGDSLLRAACRAHVEAEG